MYNMINKDERLTISGVCLCMITALLAIYLSNLVGVGLLGFEKSPLSPIIFAILLGLIIKLYFSPYNLLKYFIYVSERHRLDMINKEIEILNEFQVDKNGTKLIDGERND